MYTSALTSQLKRKVDDKSLTAERSKELQAKWELDMNNSLYINRRTSKNPFRIFFEFTDPTCNITLMRYNPGHNPFDLFDFSEAIPNPATREKAKIDDIYKKRYKAYKK